MSKLLTIFVSNIDKNRNRTGIMPFKEGHSGNDKTKFKKGQSGNPKGRPKKILSSVLDDLKKEGYERVSPANVQEAYEIVLGLDFMKLIEVSTDKELPALLNIVAKHLQSKDKAYQVLESMLDRAHGKAVQSIDQNIQGEIKLPQIKWKDE